MQQTRTVRNAVLSALTAAAAGLIIGGVAPTAARAETVVLRSGNGTIGQTDNLIHMLLGPADSAFASVFTTASFTSARTGPSAFIITPNAAWMTTLPGDSISQWISTGAGGASEGGTALYAINFTLSSTFSAASLDLRFAVDNLLGSAPNEGVYLNGTQISGSSTGGSFGNENVITRTDIAPLLNVGVNTLYLNSTDQGGPGGLLFRATINTVSAAPEPGALPLLTAGALPLVGIVLRRRRSVRVH